MPNEKFPVLVMALVMLALGIVATTVFLSTLPGGSFQSPTAEPTLPPTEPPLNVVTVLAVGVDALAAPQPVLESLVIIKYQLNFSQFYVLNLAPETLVTPGQTLRDVYAWDAPRGQGAVFTQKALQQISPGLGAIYAEADFDRAALAQTINQLEQFELGGEKLNGAMVLDRLAALAADAPPEQRLEFQGNLWRSLFQAAQKQNWDLTTLLNSLGQRFYPDADRAQVVFAAAPFLPQSLVLVSDTPLNPPAP